MKITYSLDPKSIEGAVKRLKELKTKQKLDEVCKRLADIAENTLIDLGYTGSRVDVYTEKIENGYRIVAAGKPVYFLEYGTGNKAGSGEILGTPPVDTTPGSYSNTVGAKTFARYEATGQPAKKDGTYLYEYEPKSGMFYAMKAMRENAAAVAREVFNGK